MQPRIVPSLRSEEARAALGDAGSACRFVEASVAAAFGARLSDIRADSRGRARIAFARQAAMYLAHVKLGLSLTHVGRFFGRDRTTVAHACACVEDSRDDPRRETVLLWLELAVDRWRQSYGEVR